jgi:hypothetical protein
MKWNKYVYNRIVKLNNKKTVLSIINIFHIFTVFFYIYLALQNSTHSI